MRFDASIAHQHVIIIHGLGRRSQTINLTLKHVVAAILVLGFAAGHAAAGPLEDADAGLADATTRPPCGLFVP